MKSITSKYIQIEYIYVIYSFIVPTPFILLHLFLKNLWTLVLLI